ncbi:hypothetical protein C8R46DRAFT_1299270 [Mycena filopes]|nr:hypothetical protein C8R46DRAFT_1299270 [Mycena filopes]
MSPNLGRVWEAEALHHVERMLKYIEAQTISSLVLAKDPTRRDRMLKELSESTDPRVRRGLAAEPGEDALASIRAWDTALDQAATTFEQHFFQLHYAVIAAVFYEQHVLAPAYRKYGDVFHDFYFAKFCAGSALIVSNLTGGETGQVVPQDPLIPPSADIPNIEPTVAQVLLLPPYTGLLSLRLFLRDADEDGIGGSFFWRVESINNKTTSNGTQCLFEVVPEIGNSWEECEEKVLALLLSSCICPGS